MTTVGQLLQNLAGTMDVWRDSAIAALACIVIAALWFAVSVGEP